MSQPEIISLTINSADFDKLTRTEQTLLMINDQKEVFESCDIYFNDLVPEFVVKLINGLNPDKSTHFRSNRIDSALSECFKYIALRDNKEVQP